MAVFSWSSARISLLGDAAFLGPDPARAACVRKPGQSEKKRSTVVVRHSASGFRMTIDLHHADGRRVEGRLGAADLAHHALDLGHAGDRQVLLAVDLDGLRERALRQQRGHVEERALVQRRHELAAEAGEDAALA